MKHEHLSVHLLDPCSLRLDADRTFALQSFTSDPLRWSSAAESENELLDSDGEEYVAIGRNAKRQQLLLSACDVIVLAGYLMINVWFHHCRQAAE